ncbi:MAG TPA: SMP-30/gluconolactonase/LRE family protein [Kouleothrix sp.]|uniref:SMP-30/gluconolactonase/LRE family protein n=1 Tax=Kouleothrix sp. TaxID=2779161 RepID=UPI002C518C2A|nr:SMP-30/gluconolactonase/LRE family protein [Kouleothrix sp.]HRC76625.1 SMP-30/gluconolactonase/LRE family protein [Kouleothrix sp.]
MTAPSPGALAWHQDRTIVRCPDPAIEIHDPRFEPYRLGSAVVERLWTGARWAEGPVWFGDGRFLLFSDIPNNRILRWSEETGTVTVFRAPSNYSNGHTRDRQGRLVSCEHGARRVTRTEHDGRVTVLLDQFAGKRLNAPNDVVVHSDGSVWFTDPGYGILMDYEGGKAPFELPRNVYRLEPDSGVATVVAGDFDRPNGLCFSPDERLLYVVDTGAPGHIRVFDVHDGRLSNGRVFVTMRPGGSDGIRTDRDGNLWSAAGWGGAGFDGVHCYAPDGALIGQIHLPEACSNICFGGAKKNRLFMTATQSLYAVYVEAIGAQVP